MTPAMVGWVTGPSLTITGVIPSHNDRDLEDPHQLNSSWEWKIQWADDGPVSLFLHRSEKH